jgi:dipeptidyl aminopeptidase/acylaminoacyl peptidase
MPITSLLVANLTTTSLYAASFVVEVYSDSGLTTLVGSDSCAAVSGSGGGFVQATALVVHGLTYGATYYARAGVVAPVTGKVAWSSVDTIVMGTHTTPATGFTETLTATTSGISVSVTPSSVPTDLDHYEAVWTLDGSTPASTAVPAWSGNVDGAGNITFFAGAHPGETVTIYLRSVNTTGQKQAWVSLGSASVLAAIPSSGTNLVYATPNGSSGPATLRSLVTADIPSLPESKITNLVTDPAGKVQTSRTIATTAPLTGGGDLSADRTLAISAFVASGCRPCGGRCT